jgi:hypothetical protein
MQSIPRKVCATIAVVIDAVSTEASLRSNGRVIPAEVLIGVAKGITELPPTMVDPRM